ncbi:hypothetical protein ASG40_08600 [Methylobacterium sp. Leaf399]|uniref:hypothetical protein n=1 Tax=Methylobacterium sp. Leaf399 TaxID=1736364 RepID=UPI0006F34ED3|nr:hypothetical protein [Methylobacterium sp. Leaf399]KQT09799.1 hypothetical protein ASG40_08600 [Methylobacterium sp. Leaf399]
MTAVAEPTAIIARPTVQTDATVLPPDLATDRRSLGLAEIDPSRPAIIPIRAMLHSYGPHHSGAPVRAVVAVS